MSWIPEEERPSYSLLESVSIRALRCGPIPRHVAFIMDGNRRFARAAGIEKIEGHAAGFARLSETLQWCDELGIKEVTVYAFSIENFKRPQSEVEGLLDLARDKFRRLIDEAEQLKRHGVRVKVIGNRGMLPEDLRSLIRRAEEATAENGERTLNVAFSYTSREEMTQAIRTTAAAVSRGILEASDITEELLERCLYTAHSPSVDLLIRTSGEVRLSDFMLWQSANSAVTHFSKVLWPEFSLRNLLYGVFFYQMCRMREASSSWWLSSPSENVAKIGEGVGDSVEENEDKSAARIRRFLLMLDSGKMSCSGPQ